MKKDYDLISRIDSVLRADLTDSLNDELDKTKDKMDCDKINELSAMIVGLDEEKIDTEPDKAKLIESLISQKEQRCFKIPKWAAVLVLCFGVLNLISFPVFGENIVSVIVTYVNGDVNIRFKPENDNIIELPTSENDRYGIKAKCAEYDISPETPEYIPEEFYLWNIDEEINEFSTFLAFYYKYGEKKINIFYEYYFDTDKLEKSTFGFPSDLHDFHEENINGHNMLFSWEDSQLQAIYRYENYICHYWIDGLDYETAHKIIESVK